MARFSAPQRQRQKVPRMRAPGLGGVPEPVPDIESDQLFELESTTPETGFTGIFSRTRFTSPAGQIVFGHGDAQTGVREQTGGIGPDTRQAPGTQFPDYVPDPQTFHPNERTSALDRLSEFQVAEGTLRYFRRRINATVPGFQLQDPNAMGWGKPPYPRAFRQPRFTLRKEFMQSAQTFLGQHTLVVKGGKASTSPLRMIPPRVSRLTKRADPGSFGQTTKTLNR